MIKSDLVNSIAAKANIPKSTSEKVVKAFTETITDALKSGDKVSLVGFGTFSVTKRAERKGRDPQTGKEIKIKASKYPKFKPGKYLKDSVNKR
ncbi:MAG: HU family DNA-binding protein [Thermodesulfobacteriota bacterium]|nr:HU family DNA-binding protein [Thermodesulfobacteriota bacterium]